MHINTARQCSTSIDNYVRTHTQSAEKYRLNTYMYIEIVNVRKKVHINTARQCTA